MTEPLLLTLDHAADALSISARTVRRLIDRGELTPIRIGRAVRLSTEDLRAYIDRQITQGHNPLGVAVPGDTTCHKNRGADRKPGSTRGHARRTGGPSTQTDAGARLAEVLKFDAATTRKD